jgi:hypothetical protein
MKINLLSSFIRNGHNISNICLRGFLPRGFLSPS